MRDACVVDQAVEAAAVFVPHTLGSSVPMVCTRNIQLVDAR